MKILLYFLDWAITQRDMFYQVQFIFLIVTGIGAGIAQSV